MEPGSEPVVFTDECRDLVELVTDYLDGALPPAVHAAVDHHLAECRDCAEYLAQFRTVIAVTGGLAEENISPEAQQRLCDMFRDLLGRRSRKS